MLNDKLRGHYGYYGITHNIQAMREYYYQVRRTWWFWLNRRGSTPVNWECFEAFLNRNQLREPRIIHSLYRPCERSA